MRFQQKDPWSGKLSGAVSAEHAVQIQVECGAAGYDGQLERLQAKIEETTRIVGRLIDFMPTPTGARAEELAGVIGSFWQLEELHDSKEA